MRIYFNTQADANPKVLDAIAKADKIVFAPGDLYTSVLPHLLVEGVAEAIRKSNAKLIFILNLIEKKGETDNFKASDFIKAFVYYLGDSKRLDFIVTNIGKFDKEIVKVYEGEGKKAVILDEPLCKKIAPRAKIIKGSFWEYLKKAHLLRHDPLRLAQAVLKP